MKESLKVLSPKIGMFSPFDYPFAKSEKENKYSKHMVDPRIYEYMLSDDTKIVAKCTPCQCCACR